MAANQWVSHHQADYSESVGQPSGGRHTTIQAAHMDQTLRRLLQAPMSPSIDLTPYAGGDTHSQVVAWRL